MMIGIIIAVTATIAFEMVMLWVFIRELTKLKKR
jgi:hypothetical protein